MSNLLRLSIVLLISLSTSASHMHESGRQKYEQILSLSTSTSTCWQQVLSLLQNYCSLDQLDQYQSTIAYQFTLCHLSNMQVDLTHLQCEESRVESCVEKLHQHMNAFIAYTEFYPFVQSICYVLREKSAQADLTTHLTLFLNHSEEIMTKLISSVHLQNQLTAKVKHQQHVQEIILTNAQKLKQVARTNLDKTQNILSNIIQTARHEYDLLKQICSLSQTIQTIVRITCAYSFWFYALSMFAIYIVTIPKRTNQARTILFGGMFLYVLVERYYQMSSMINFSQWRLICWTCCLLILLHYAYKYRSRKEMHHERLHRIATNLIQTEATFHRVSRELKRARSRSRSRSVRAKRQAEKLSSPLVQDSRPIDNAEENKENIEQNPLIDDDNDQSFVVNATKRHYSLLVPKSTTSTRILMKSRQMNSNI